jgi:geranylgeranyl pyrophosphate synthase/predicted secreted hydrolase
MRPTDWPAAGPIDLAIHDRPHRSSTTEWWYLNCHVETADGRPLSLFAAFFRIVRAHDPRTNTIEHAHSCTWAITDPSGRRYLPESRVDARAPEMGLERIKKGHGAKDPRLNRAMIELLERGRTPEPDRVFEGEVEVAMDRLALDFAGARLEKRGDGSYRLRLSCAREGTGCDLVFHPERAPVRHGDDGVVKGHGGEDMFYYFIPRCRVEGTITLDNKSFEVARGQGWYDHEFGAPPKRAEGDARPVDAAEHVDIAWNWVAVQLDGGGELSAYQLVRADDGVPLHDWAIWLDKNGERRALTSFTLTPRRWFRSTRTFYDYPVAWRLEVPGAGLDLTVEAELDDQELITCISKPAFWEGRCRIGGTLDGAKVAGVGFVERSGFQPVKTLDDFFAAVGEEVQASVARLLPDAPTHAEARGLIAADDREQYMQGVDLGQLARALWRPIRDYTDRGGKSWRSYAALACCDVVRGDSRKFVKWLAVPELLHVGSLIVDDVQDRSTVRRGGPTAHVVYGDPIAINAGTAAYFIAQRLLVSEELSAETKLRLYDLYFEAMRAGHAGQALDLDSFASLMPDVVERGDAKLLEERVLAVHRLKTAAPAAALARMGAVAGGGTDAQIEAVGGFFEALGLAFQIVDDVLNLRGFKGGLKSRGEDIANGAITLPVAKAMGLMPRDARRALWRTLAAKPKDLAVIAATVEALEVCGAIEAAAAQARALVEEAWWRADPHLPDCVPKVMLRAFGWYVLERHY